MSIPLVRRLVASVVSGGAALLLATPVLAHGDEAPAPVLPGVLLAWRPDIVPILGVLVAAAAYGWAFRQVATRHPANPPRAWRAWTFGAGLAEGS